MATTFSDRLAAALEKERFDNAQRITRVRLAGISVFFGIFLLLGTVLGIRSWQGNLGYFAPYWLLTIALYLAGRRFPRVLVLSSLAIAFVDMPMVFVLNWATFPTTPNVGAVAGYALGIFVFLLIVEALSLAGWQIFVTAFMGAVCEGALQYFAGISVGAIVCTFVIMGLAAATCAYGSRRLLTLLVTLTIDQDKLDIANNELTIARRIQTSILPKDLTVPGFDVAAVMKTATEVGGDYYDLRPTDDGFWLGVGDVTGHGLDAGLVMLMIQTGVATLTSRADATPVEVVCALNAVVYDNVRKRLERDDHATFTLMKVTNDGTITLAGAHEELIVWRAKTGQCESLPTVGTWIGARKDIRKVTPSTTYVLEPGDTLLAYTDGVTEARNPSREMFGDERLIAALQELGSRPAHEIITSLQATVSAWTAEQEDDFSMVCVRFAPAA